MNFSLKHLLSITLLSVLTVNGLNNLRETKLVQQNCRRTKHIVDKRIGQTEHFAEKKLIFTRAANAFDQRRDKLENADVFFRPVAMMHQRLQIDDLKNLFVAASDDGNPDSKSHVDKSFRIIVPESRRFELCLGYHATNDGGSKDPPLLRESSYFSPELQFRKQLTAGDHFVQLSVTSFQDRDSVTLKIDGVNLHQSSRPSVPMRHPDWVDSKRPNPLKHQTRAEISKELETLAELNRRKTHALSTTDKNLFEAESLLLADINHWPTVEDPESLSLVIRDSDLNKRLRQQNSTNDDE
ncbi:hypothetical protein [Mariniblastus fucicola]|uniref:Uncharacterized protein n=1 Tax=Mariniblastus fucicola TaxID=980251 RepID=A0A5B9P6H9_9BACT|nr:hypothetical protein [Mariniblastus fucicola]QEG22197.1 hypothetical protein MFFC18_20580 [Mariniblastus fucicola]